MRLFLATKAIELLSDEKDTRDHLLIVFNFLEFFPFEFAIIKSAYFPLINAYAIFFPSLEKATLRNSDVEEINIFLFFPSLSIRIISEPPLVLSST